MKWARIHDRIAFRDMPPAKKPRPEELEKAEALKWLAVASDLPEVPERAVIERVVVEIRREWYKK